MKKLLLLLLLLPFGASAQTTRVVPDCVISFNFTTTASTSNLTCGAPNGQQNGQGIASWILVYYSTGFSAISIVVQSAADNAGVPGTYGTFAGTVLSSSQYPGSSGANPNTVTTSAFTGFAGYYPWMRVTLSSITGTGKVTGNLYGFYNSTLAKATSGGGTVTIAGTASQIVVTGAGCGGTTGTCTISLPNPNITINAGTGNFFTPGTVASGSASGVSGALELAQGTVPSSFPSNSFSLYSPTSIGTSYQWLAPSADALGFVRSSGAATPGVLSIVGETGTGNVVRAVAPTIGLVNGTGLPVSTGISGLGTGVAAALATNVSGSGAICLATGSACTGGGTGVTSVNTATGAVTLFTTNAQTSTYQVLAADFVGCKTIPVASGTFTITLVASGSQPPTGQCIMILNYGTGVVTLARSGQNINGAASNLTGTAGSATAPTGWYVVSDGTNYVAEVIGGSGGGGGATVHHQYFTAATGTSTTDNRVSFNGQNSGHLGTIPLGIFGAINANGTFNVEIYLPSTWTSTISVALDLMTSTNNTGNFSIIPSFACAGNGFDLGNAPSYTTGSTVTTAAPGGAGSGFYRESVVLSFSGSGCSATNTIILKFTRGASDTYADSLYLLGGDVAITY
jgi:hypothetical protein